MKIDNADLSDDVLEYMVQQVDLNNDGTISFDEFVKMLQVGEDVVENGHNSLDLDAPTTVRVVTLEDTRP